MRKTFEPLDDVLIERLFQPASDLMLYRIGMGPGKAACLCVDVACLAWIASRAPGLLNAVAAWDAGAAFLDAALVLLGIVALISLRILFRRAGVNQGSPLRPAMRPHRAIVLLMLVASLVQSRMPELASAADIAMLMFATSALYLGACKEPPPVRRALPGLIMAG